MYALALCTVVTCLSKHLVRMILKSYNCLWHLLCNFSRFNDCTLLIVCEQQQHRLTSHSLGRSSIDISMRIFNFNTIFRHSIEIRLMDSFDVYTMIMYHHRHQKKHCYAPLNPSARWIAVLHIHIQCEFFFVALTRSIKDLKKKMPFLRKNYFVHFIPLVCSFKVGGLPLIGRTHTVIGFEFFSFSFKLKTI